MATGNDFFTLQSLATFAGASSATLAIGNAVQFAFNFNPRWFALAAAEFICLGVVAAGQIDGSAPAAVTPFFVAFLNGFLVFCSAAGLTAAGGDVQRRRSGAPGGMETMISRTLGGGNGSERRGFWRPWF